MIKPPRLQPLSVFDMFKIGVGPSSSHTMGPWLAAGKFVERLSRKNDVSVATVAVELYGALAKTGNGHGTGIAVQLGLCGYSPRTIDVESITPTIKKIAQEKRLSLHHCNEIAFDPKADIHFHHDIQLPFHPNGMKLTATYSDGTESAAVFFSIGGGFIVEEGDVQKAESLEECLMHLPWPIEHANDLLRYCSENSAKIADIVLQNELTWRAADKVRAGLTDIKDAMLDCIHRGCRTGGTLPGGLNVERRAARMAHRLLGHDVPECRETSLAEVKQQSHDFQRILNWVSCFALAVNEENAAFGRVVTAPTNGSAGVIPSVLLYCLCFCDLPEDCYINFLLTAGEIGCIFKKGATISAALGGCQAEIGVSSAMAAAALAECLGGTPGQAAEAAEIAMEHHLGMTCDPIGGLVQIPCIERNAMGAIKAITAAQMSLQRDCGEARVSLDAVIRTMWETALDMNAKYKETSEGGLAMQIAVNVSEC